MEWPEINCLIAVTDGVDTGCDIAESIEYMSLEDLLNPLGSGMVDGSGTSAEPDWNKVRSECISLLERSKNLWVAVFLAYSLAKIGGIAGLNKGMELIKAYIEVLWDKLYPGLDHDDGDDPYERMNALGIISPEPGGKFGVLDFIELISNIPLSNSRQIGSFSYRQYKQSFSGKQSSTSDSPPEVPTAAIEASFRDSAQNDLQNLRCELLKSKDLLNEICKIFAAKTFNAHRLNYSRIISLVDDIIRFLTGFCDLPAVVEASASVEKTSLFQHSSNMASTVVKGDGQTLISTINSTNDAVNMLKKVCEYFEKNEPSSPVPLLIKRAIKLVSMSFNDIIEDVCPEALRQIEWLIPNNQKQ